MSLEQENACSGRLWIDAGDEPVEVSGGRACGSTQRMTMLTWGNASRPRRSGGFLVLAGC